jgi:hypothetical protein
VAINSTVPTGSMEVVKVATPSESSATTPRTSVS